jgi:hypothetical protein
MSQFNLTPEEDQLVVDALQAKTAQYLAMYGVIDPVASSLLEKLLGQLPAVVAAAPEAVVEQAQAEAAPAEVPAEE